MSAGPGAAQRRRCERRLGFTSHVVGHLEVMHAHADFADLARGEPEQALRRGAAGEESSSGIPARAVAVKRGEEAREGTRRGGKRS